MSRRPRQLSGDRQRILSLLSSRYSGASCSDPSNPCCKCIRSIWWQRDMAVKSKRHVDSDATRAGRQSYPATPPSSRSLSSPLTPTYLKKAATPPLPPPPLLGPFSVCSWYDTKCVYEPGLARWLASTSLFPLLPRVSLCLSPPICVPVLSTLIFMSEAMLSC